MSRVTGFAIEHTAILDADGRLLQPLPAWCADPAALVELYRWMVLTRTFDTTAIALHRTGRLGTYASSRGQEAIAIGVGHAMHPDDVLLPSFREHGAQLLRGVLPEELLLYWGGDERGSNYSAPACRQDFPVSITVGGHASHATGVALAFKLRGEARAAVCLFGDGATSKGDVYEAMNFAGVQQLPVVFVVSNNAWALSTPRAEQSAGMTIAQKAIAAGFTGEQVDGNDVIAVRTRVGEAIDRARSGNGPHFLECLTYRMSDHTTVDDASRYRNPEEVEPWEARDPLSRLRAYLVGNGAWDEARDDALRASCAATIDTAVQAYLDTPPQPPETLFDFLFEAPPQALREQRRTMLDAVKAAQARAEASGNV